MFGNKWRDAVIREDSERIKALYRQLAEVKAARDVALEKKEERDWFYDQFQKTAPLQFDLAQHAYLARTTQGKRYG